MIETQRSKISNAIVVAMVTLTCSPAFAWQSGSRSSAPAAGSGGRVAAPSFGSPTFSTPTPATGQVFQPTLPATQSFQTAPQFQGQIGQPVTTFQNGAPVPGEVASSMPGQPSNSPPASANGSTGSSSLGIPDSSLVDPIFEIHNPNSNYAIDHSAWDCFLSQYIVTDAVGVNRLRYAQVTPQDRNALKCYLQNLQSVDTRTLNRDEQLAYWFNLYNAKTADTVLDNYPIRSIRQIKTKLTDFVGPFDDPGAVTVLGKPLSLNDIESGIVRPVWNDPRIHYALNCASFGCPNLSPQAWTGNDLDGQLNGAAYQYVNSGRAVRRGLFGVRTSKIYKWYKDDFGGNDQAVLNHIRQYANESTLQNLQGRQKIVGHYYDWSLNDGRVQRRRWLEPIIR